MGNPEYDSDLQLQDRGDFYILSVKFFKFFYDVYGCNQIVNIKYRTHREEVQINIDPLQSSHRMYKIEDAGIMRGPEISALYEGEEQLLPHPKLRKLKQEAQTVLSQSPK